MILTLPSLKDETGMFLIISIGHCSKKNMWLELEEDVEPWDNYHRGRLERTKPEWGWGGMLTGQGHS
jgi:hypothetical protein